jgi:hypothetical protein
MYVLFRYPVGVIVEGVVLASGRNRMRVAARGFADIIELKRSGSNWINADRECVAVEFIMSRSSETPVDVVMPMHSGPFMTFANAN